MALALGRRPGLARAQPHHNDADEQPTIDNDKDVDVDVSLLRAFEIQSHNRPSIRRAHPYRFASLQQRHGKRIRRNNDPADAAKPPPTCGHGHGCTTRGFFPVTSLIAQSESACNNKARHAATTRPVLPATVRTTPTYESMAHASQSRLVPWHSTEGSPHTPVVRNFGGMNCKG
ncbi:hypothetical protein ACJQWK_06659 [Exserohilum turcicum]